MAIKIMVDPGHKDGENSMASMDGYSGYCEGTRMWFLKNYLIPSLEVYGFVVGCTRTDSRYYPGGASTDDIVGRGKMAAGYDLMLSLHSNACATESVNRPVVIYPVSGKCKDLAAMIGAALQSAWGLQNYQTFCKFNSAGTADYYGVIRGAASVGTPCLIIEHFFHTNKACCAKGMVDSNLKTLALATAQAVADYYGYTKTSGSTSDSAVATTPSSETEIYRVRKAWNDPASQIGAYRSLQSAKSVCDAHGGYYVFDSSGNAIYPEGDGETVTAAHSSITKYQFKAGSTSVPVYCDTALTTNIGSLNAGEVCSCVEAGTSLLLVWYALDNGNGYKAGYVRRSAGTVY